MLLDGKVKDVEGPKTTEYELKSVVCHRGASAYCGHYVCYRLDEKWVLLNDRHVMESDVVMEDAYLVFYHAKQ